MDKELHALIEAFKGSEEYIRFLKAKKKVLEFPGLQEQIDRFRSVWYRLQSNSDADLFEKIEHVEAEYAKLRENPYVQEFLASELAVCRMFQKVNWAILKNLDFDTDFLKDNY